MNGERDAVGVYGKIPSEGDFVRVNASDPSAQSLDVWVQESLEALQRAGVDLPPEPLFFLHQGPHPAVPPVIGALVPSHDRVGRVYPVLVFARVDPALAQSRLPALHVTYGQFLLDAAQMLRDLPRADAQLLAAWSRRLRLPAPATVATCDTVCRDVLEGCTVGEFARRAFPAASAIALHYAFRTALDACDAARSRPSKVAITLECPVSGDLDGFVWLELVRRRLYGTPVRPSVAWREGAQPAMLIALGPAPGSMLRQLARRGDQASHLWPLTTDRGDVMEQSYASMAPHHRQVLDAPGAPLEALLSTLSR